MRERDLDIDLDRRRNVTVFVLMMFKVSSLVVHRMCVREKGGEREGDGETLL